MADYGIVDTRDGRDESARFYDPLTGRIVETIRQKNGKTAKPTTRHGRALGLVPSVTSVLSRTKNYGLEKWKRDQLLMSALTTKRMPGESDSALVRRVIREAERPGEEAADRGTEMHAGFEEWVETGNLPKDRATLRMVTEIARWLEDRGWTPNFAERKFASAELGYAGTVDSGGSTPDGRGWVGDIKTRDFKGNARTVKAYDKYLWQMCAYAKGIQMENCWMVSFMVDRETGAMKARMWTDFEVKLGMQYWHHTFELWCLENYDPRKKVQPEKPVPLFLLK